MFTKHILVGGFFQQIFGKFLNKVIWKKKSAQILNDDVIKNDISVFSEIC